jgi:hypothetical protein
VSSLVLPEPDATATAAKPVEPRCPRCNYSPEGSVDASDRLLPQCLVCGNQEIYKKKDFPHWLGLAILALACLGSIIPYWLYHQWLTWAILIGSAAFDGLLYLWVGDVLVCYRCQSEYRGFVSTDEHKPFELGNAERYRQERIRREQLQAAKKANEGL